MTFSVTSKTTHDQPIKNTGTGAEKPTQSGDAHKKRLDTPNNDLKTPNLLKKSFFPPSVGETPDSDVGYHLSHASTPVDTDKPTQNSKTAPTLPVLDDTQETQPITLSPKSSQAQQDLEAASTAINALEKLAETTHQLLKKASARKKKITLDDEKFKTFTLKKLSAITKDKQAPSKSIANIENTLKEAFDKFEKSIKDNKINDAFEALATAKVFFESVQPHSRGW